MSKTQGNTRCYWCGKKEAMGMHPICWENLKGFALGGADIPQPIEHKRPEAIVQNVLGAGRVATSTMSDNINYEDR